MIDLVRFLDDCKMDRYAGIGSRDTPADICALMTRIAIRLDRGGWTLRSGGAEKADEAFDHCVTRAEIYLPWPRFTEKSNRMHPLPSGPNVIVRSSIPLEAFAIAEKHHPNWMNLRDSHQRLHTRNVPQILGNDCKSPVAFVVCWTPDGSTGITTPKTRGTGQALRIAHAHGIPIFNLQREDHRAAWERLAG